MEQPEINKILLKYLALPTDYELQPSQSPIQFAKKHIHELPPDLACLLSTEITPKQRTQIPAVRNRRLRYTESNPQELTFVRAKSTWPMLWEGRELRGKDEGKEEQEWVDKEFLSGSRKHVGKLGNLLGGYEEEREVERVRAIRRHEAELAESLPEEDEDTTDEDEPPQSNVEDERPEDTQIWFLRLVKERFIYGLLNVRSLVITSITINAYQY